MYMCWVSILQKIWLVITYYGTSSASPLPRPRIGKIPSLALSRRCNIETNYGWNWKVTSLFRLDQTTAKRISADVEIPPKCFLLHYHHWHLRHSQFSASAVDINIDFSSCNAHGPKAAQPLKNDFFFSCLCFTNTFSLCITWFGRVHINDVLFSSGLSGYEGESLNIKRCDFNQGFWWM